MPLYTYVCDNNHQFDRFLKLKDYKQPQTCDCGAESRRKIMPTMVNCDIAPWDHYISPASGKLITSYKDRKADMKETGCVDYEPSLRDDQTKYMNDQEAKLEKRMDETVDQLVEAMPARKKELLESELASGADCVVERR